MKTASWVKNHVNVDSLQDSLKQFEKTWNAKCVTSDFYLSVSKSIRILSQQAISEPYLLRDWVWINAQFRIAHPFDEDTAQTSWAAIRLLISMVDQLNSGNQEIISSICWLTDRTMERLLDQLGPQAINRFISSEEQYRIDDLIIELAELVKEDLEELEAAANEIAREFSTIHHTAYFPSIATKLLGLCHKAHESSEAGYWSKAALRYIHLEHDVINDNQGYVGLLDDIHVIENMYEFVFGELPWKRLIGHASEKWTFLTRTYWSDEDTTNQLAPLLKAAISCCLDSSLEHNQSRIIVLPEIGPCGFLSTAACVMAETGPEARIVTPKPGTLASFREGHIPRFVMMMFPYEFPDGTVLQKIKLRDCVRSISAEHVTLLEPVLDTESSLGTSKQFDKWLSSLEADSQTAIHRFHRTESKTSVVYVTKKSDFFNLLEKIRPYGRRLDELVAVEYRSRINKSSLGSGAGAKSPAMIVCSNLDVAESIVRNEGEDLCRPHYMIIDRTVDHSSLAGLVERIKQYCPEINIVIFSQVDTDARFYLKNWNESVWLIKPEDIDTPPDKKNPIPTSYIGKGLLANYVNRQNFAPFVKFKTHYVEFLELNKFYEIAKKIMQRAKDEQEMFLWGFAMNAEAVLRKISTYPPVGNSIGDTRLKSMLTSLSQHTMAAGMFDQDIDNLASSSNKLIEVIKNNNPKTRALFDLIGDYKDCHIVVASRSIAESISKTGFNIECAKVKFVSVQDLDSLDDIKLLIVPGWLGKKEMLRLQFGGWSGVQIRLLYNFEYQRLAIQSKNLDATYSYLDKRTRESWEIFSIDNPEAGKPPTVIQNYPTTEKDPNLEKYGDDQPDEEDWLESAVRRRITSKSVNSTNRAAINGRLVFFNDGQHYGVFAENAKLVCLDEVQRGGLEITQLSERETEKLLWKSTKHLEIGDVLAFPDDPALGDIIGGIADAIVGDDGVTREKSGLWRNELRRLCEKCGWNLERTQEELSKCGVERTISTLSSWLYSSKTVAPKNPSETIPTIFECAGSVGSLDLAHEILKDVYTIYAARRKAGRILVSQLSTASLSALGDRAFVEINGKEVRYKVLSISSIDALAKFDAAYIGVHSISDKYLGPEL